MYVFHLDHSSAVAQVTSTELGRQFYMYTLIVAILYCMKGISRNIANGILVMAAASASSLPMNIILRNSAAEQSLSAVPQNVRTGLRILDVEPKISQSICCASCFSLYPLSTKEVYCQQQYSTQSRKCGTPLFRKDNLPKKLYAFQSFTHWLSSFVKRPGYQELLETSRTQDGNGSEGESRPIKLRMTRCKYDLMTVSLLSSSCYQPVKSLP